MPVNFLHHLVHRPGRGWDPVSPALARNYDAAIGASPSHSDTSLVERLCNLAGGLEGKHVLDLGGGPGQHSILFARYGALVTWHDVSRQYEMIARRRAEAARANVVFSLGYLEDAAKFGKGGFDLVFCNLCWYYCRSDRSFGRLIYDLVKPGGIGYIACNT